MFKNKKENWLLYIGAGIFSCTFIVYVALTTLLPNYTTNTDKFGDFDNILIVIISTLIIAPFLEELIFRGIFTQKKLFQFFFYPGTIIMIIYTKNFYLIFVLLVIFLIFYQKKTYTIKQIFFLNSILFALIHYKLENLSSIYNIVPIFFQFSLAFIFIWVAINFGLKWSILFHFIFNAIIIIPILFLIQFPNEQNHILESNKFTFSWKKTPAIGVSKIHYREKLIDAEKITINELISLFNGDKSKLKINDSLKFYRYNFSIKSLNNEKIEFDDMKIILSQANLIEINK